MFTLVCPTACRWPRRLIGSWDCTTRNAAESHHRAVSLGTRAPDTSPRTLHTGLGRSLRLRGATHRRLSAGNQTPCGTEAECQLPLGLEHNN